ncbi:MAG: sensor histidine kinase [Actinomycetota bacterium]
MTSPSERDVSARLRIPLGANSRFKQLAGYVVAVAGTSLLTAAVLPFRSNLNPLTEAFGYLTLVVVVAWIGGLAPGVFASILCFVTFNFFFLKPYNTFVVERPEYVVVLFVQLGISVLVSSLIGRTRERIRAAEQRESELAALQDLGSELVGRMPGPDSYHAILSRLSSWIGFPDSALLVEDDEVNGRLVVLASTGDGQQRASIGVSDAGSAARFPLVVGHRNLGLLLLWGERTLGSGESRVLRAFCDQLALVLERDRLLRVAAKAESFHATEKLRRALLTAVSHDLRSPLSAIKTSVTDLMDAPADADYQREVLESVDSEVDRLNGLIANLLDMSRIEAGMLRARTQSVDVAEVIAGSVAQMQRRWPSVRFNVSIAPSASDARADPVYLDRIVTNLLDNAARSSTEAEHPTVEIEARPSADRTPIVRVCDHGRGIPDSLREHLFHPFYQLDERSSRLGPGLGLAICKGFVSSMGGEIWVEQTPGGGTTFAFSLKAGDAA